MVIPSTNILAQESIRSFRLFWYFRLSGRSGFPVISALRSFRLSGHELCYGRSSPRNQKKLKKEAQRKNFFHHWLPIVKEIAY
jgi:hypothetical protein